MNKGLSDKLVTEFPDITPVPRPEVTDQEIKDPNWLAGFTDGEGCFLVNYFNSPSSKSGEGVSLVFSISQHKRDIQLLESLVKHLNCGNCYPSRDIVSFVVWKFTDIYDKKFHFLKATRCKGLKLKTMKILRK